MTRVLVVDDEPQILRALKINLRARHFEVITAATGAEALAAAAAHPPDLVILDLGVPDIDGVEVIRGLRGWCAAPIVVLSGRSESFDKVEALDAGADDYVTTPFSVVELLARMRAVARRVTASEDILIVTFGRTTVDLAARRVTLRDGDRSVAVRLTPTEWHLLEVLVQHPGKLLSQRQMLSEVWEPGYDNAGGNLCGSTWPSCGASWSRTRPGPATCVPSRGWATGWSPGRWPTADGLAVGSRGQQNSGAPAASRSTRLVSRFTQPRPPGDVGLTLGTGVGCSWPRQTGDATCFPGVVPNHAGHRRESGPAGWRESPRAPGPLRRSGSSSPQRYPSCVTRSIMVLGRRERAGWLGRRGAPGRRARAVALVRRAGEQGGPVG